MREQSKAALYFQLTKPRIILMVAITLVIGFYLAPGDHSTWRLLATLVGVAVSSAGASALNHCLERDTDKLMDRTKNRPVASGKLTPLNALLFGVIMVLAGVLFLKWQVNLLTSFIVLLTAFLYVLVYTPLKKLTWLNTFVGSIPGALPPVAGWTAAADGVDLGAYLLFLILFAWQHPHFYALAWIYKDDYARGGLKMLPVVDASGNRTVTHILLYCVILLAVSILPVHFGMAGTTYFVGALILGLCFFAMGVRFSRARTLANARGLFRSSLVYFPALLVLILIDSNI